MQVYMCICIHEKKDKKNKIKTVTDINKRKILFQLEAEKPKKPEDNMFQKHNSYLNNNNNNMNKNNNISNSKFDNFVGINDNDDNRFKLSGKLWI